MLWRLFFLFLLQAARAVGFFFLLQVARAVSKFHLQAGGTFLLLIPGAETAPVSGMQDSICMSARL